MLALGDGVWMSFCCLARQLSRQANDCAGNKVDLFSAPMLILCMLVLSQPVSVTSAFPQHLVALPPVLHASTVNLCPFLDSRWVGLSIHALCGKDNYMCQLHTAQPMRWKLAALLMSCTSIRPRKLVVQLQAHALLC